MGDVAHLVGEIAGHRVDVFGEVLPRPRNALDLRLTAELSFGADFSSDARHLVGERRQLIDHGVDRRPDAAELALDRLAFHFQGHLLRQVAVGHGHDHARDLVGGANQVVHHRVDRVDFLLPRPTHRADAGALGQPPFASDEAPDAYEFLGHRRIARCHLVVGVGEISHDPGPVTAQTGGEVALGHRAKSIEQLLQLGGAGDIAVGRRRPGWFSRRCRRTAGGRCFFGRVRRLTPRAALRRAPRAGPGTSAAGWLAGVVAASGQGGSPRDCLLFLSRTCRTRVGSARGLCENDAS